MSELSHRRVAVNGVHLHIAEQGEGPLVVFCHGFPGLWYSWRHQLPAIAAAGWRAVAMDMRGYGRSDRPVDPALYDADHMAADMLGLLDALGERSAVFIGQDFGAPLVWDLALRAPERVDGVVALSVPYDFDLAGRGGSAGDDSAYFASPHRRPSEAFAATARQHFFHMHYFQAIGPAERELGNQVRPFLRKLFWALSAEGNLLDWTRYPSESTGYLDVLAEPARELPWSWLSEEDMNYYVAEYECGSPQTAFIGGLNSYRCADRNWELNARFIGATIERPALFITGEHDPVLKVIRPDALAIMRCRVADLRGELIVPAAGHWVQQEQPEAVNAALLAFLASLTAIDTNALESFR